MEDKGQKKYGNVSGNSTEEQLERVLNNPNGLGDNKWSNKQDNNSIWCRHNRPQVRSPRYAAYAGKPATA